MPGPFYTREGDDGYTGLLGPGRVPKEDLRMEAVGTVDEVNAAIGLARAHTRSSQSRELILQTQRDLYGLMAELAATPENAARFRTITAERVDWLETQVDILKEQVEAPGEFIVPGDTVEGAFFDLARTLVRRAERRAADLLHRGELENREIPRYLNRLSSLFFVLELFENALIRGAGKTNITLAKVDESK